MTDDDVKAANEALVESMVQQLRDCASVGDEMTLDDVCLLDDAADWIAGEPARIAATREKADEAVRYWTDLAQAEARDAAAARARVAELEEQARVDDLNAVHVNDAHLRQVAALRAERDEAVAALRALVEARPYVPVHATEREAARAVLAKHPKVKR